MIKNFGTQESAYLSEIKPVFYYQFQTPKVTAAAGIFTRDMMHDDDYSTAFFSESERFFHNRTNGVLAQYNGKRDSYVEFVCDWEGMYSTLSREKFRILLAGRHYLDTFYYGFNYSMFHYAGQQGAPIENVVDLQLLNPCVGVRFNAFFDFDIKLGALLTAQRDRSFGHSWEKPCMGEFAFRISRWGLSLDERLYVGDNIHPFFYGHELEDGTPLPYGRELYPAESFFRTDQKVYSRTALSYRRSFFDDTVSVRAEFAAHRRPPWEPSKCWSWGETAQNRLQPAKIIKNNMASETNETREKSLNFLEEIIEESIARGETRAYRPVSRPNQTVTCISAAKSVCINWTGEEIWRQVQPCASTTRTPVKEDVEYVDSIKRDIQWLGFQWELERYASDYFDQLYEWAVVLIKKGLAYVDDQTQDEIRENRGTVSVPGTPSPWRDRSVEENFDLFTRMKNGEFPDGAKVLRAKIDMAPHPNSRRSRPDRHTASSTPSITARATNGIYPMCDFTPAAQLRLDRRIAPLDLRQNSTCTSLPTGSSGARHFPLTSTSSHA